MDKFKAVFNSIRFSKPVRTAAQTAVAVIGTNAVNVTDVDWIGVVSASALSAVLCILLAVGDGSDLSGKAE